MGKDIGESLHSLQMVSLSNNTPVVRLVILRGPFEYIHM